MAQFNENIKIVAPNPIDDRYLSPRTSAGSQLPYSADTEVFSTIGSTVRYTGLTVLIQSGETNIEYWFKEGVADIDLKQKSPTQNDLVGEFVTGATNIGFFSGTTGVQTLPITHATLGSCYDGDYNSLYNWYYRGTDGGIHIGTPDDGIPKRGYVRPPTITNAAFKSWVWNERTVDASVGWVLTCGNLATQLGTFQSVESYAPQYTATTWTKWCSNGSPVSIATPIGSLTGGTEITIGGPVYNDKIDSTLRLRTIKTETPNIIDVKYDEAFVYVNATSDDFGGQNIGTGEGDVYSGRTGNTFIYRTIKGSGDTIVSQTDTEVVIYSSGGTGGGTYNLATPATVTVGGITDGTQLTGKTSFELFQQMLVVYQTPTFSSFSTAIPTTVEVGCNITGSPSFSWAFSNASNVADNTMCVFDITSGVTLATNISTTSPQTIGIADKTFGSCCEIQRWCGSAKNTCSDQFNSSTYTVTALLPWYWGVCTCPGAPGDNRPIADCDMVLSGTKLLATSASNISVPFNSGANDYLWFAIPSTVTDKTCWCLNSSVYGAIGGGVSAGCNLFPDPDGAISVTTSCWSGKNYDVYISNKQSTATTLKMGYA